jgi:hypothetical protein
MAFSLSPTFRPIAVPNNASVLYQLSIRAPNSQFSEFATYTFPLSPSGVRYERSTLSSMMDVQGPPSKQGVTRVIDTYGQAPPMITVEGTTGWDRHSMDGYILTGLQSIQLLQQFISSYASLNQTQMQQGTAKLYALEWYDFFSNQFWVVEPIGPQMVWQDTTRPMLTNYRFRFAASVQPGLPNVALHEIDSLASLIATPAAQAALMAAQTVTAMTVAYAPTGIVSDAFAALP